MVAIRSSQKEKKRQWQCWRQFVTHNHRLEEDVKRGCPLVSPRLGSLTGTHTYVSDRTLDPNVHTSILCNRPRTEQVLKLHFFDHGLNRRTASDRVPSTPHSQPPQGQSQRIYHRAAAIALFRTQRLAPLIQTIPPVDEGRNCGTGEVTLAGRRTAKISVRKLREVSPISGK